MKFIKIQVPATTGNIGPGFDVLGAALNRYNLFTFTENEQPLSITITGPHGLSGSLPTDESNLVYQSFCKVFQQQGLAIPHLNLTLDIQLPPGRGLGSSATAIIAGLFAANVWLDSPLSQKELLALAVDIEGHPDNVAPALLGGCILNVPNQTTPIVIPTPPHLDWIICSPEFELATHDARQVLPEKVDMTDCIFNLGSLATLISGFYSGQIEQIKWGLKDCLHQPYRQSLVPGMADVIEKALEHGAIGCVLSGAGPTILAITEQNSKAIASQMEKVWKSFNISAQSVISTIDTKGTQIVS